jgi:sulfonate transport system substrate-binding protein
MKLRELAVLAAVLGLAAGGLTGCGTPATGSGGPAPVPVPAAVSPQQLSRVTLRVGDQKGIGAQVLLQASGQLAGLPYRVQWSTFTSGPPMLEAADAHAIDVGQVGNTPPIFSAAAHGDIDIVAALHSPVGDALLVPKGSPVTDPAQLRGKTIAVAKGSSAHGTLLGALTRAGLKPSDVTLSYLQPSDASAAFTQGSVAAWAVWEPYVSEAVQQLGARELVDGADARAQGLSNALTVEVASRTALADPGTNAALRDYVTRIAKANLWARDHPDQWAATYARLTGLPLAVTRAAVPRLALTPALVDGSVLADEQKLADQFTAAGQLPGTVDLSGYLDRRYNDAIAPLVNSGR